MRITEIEIDDRNEAHLTSHGVSIAEVQQVFANHPDVRRNRKDWAGTHVARGVTKRRTERDPSRLSIKALAGFDRSLRGKWAHEQLRHR